MFDIGWSELLVIGIVALVVIGPKDLPQAFRVAGQWVAKARNLAREFQSHVDDMVRESDMSDMKREFSDMTRVPEIDEIEADLMRGEVPKSEGSKKEVGKDEPSTVITPPAP
jgi:sec-independent protein translocase protein TatB